jgi:hypothetical protein
MNYETSDTAIAAFLIASKVPYRGAGRTGNRVTFSFEDNGTVTQLAWSYLADATIPAKSLIEATRFVTGQLKAARQQNESTSTKGEAAWTRKL